jgi:hypothetical protein
LVCHSIGEGDEEVEEQEEIFMPTTIQEDGGGGNKNTKERSDSDSLEGSDLTLNSSKVVESAFVAISEDNVVANVMAGHDGGFTLKQSGLSFDS